MTTLHFTNARLIDPEAQSDVLGTLTVEAGVIAALNGADKFKTEKGAPLHTDILHAPLPAGRAARSTESGLRRSINRERAAPLERPFRPPPSASPAP